VRLDGVVGAAVRAMGVVDSQQRKDRVRGIAEQLQVAALATWPLWSSQSGGISRSRSRHGAAGHWAAGDAGAGARSRSQSAKRLARAAAVCSQTLPRVTRQSSRSRSSSLIERPRACASDWAASLSRNSTDRSGTSTSFVHGVDRRTELLDEVPHGTSACRRRSGSYQPKLLNHSHIRARVRRAP